MHALPFLLALLAAAVLAPVLLRALREGGHVRPNYRERALPFPFGVLALVAALLALIPLMLIQRLASTGVLYPEALPVALYALGVLGLGLLDDLLAPGGQPGETGSAAQASQEPRGWRGHGAAVLRGEFSTGALKAAGSLGLALLAMSYLGLSNGRWLLAAGVLGTFVGRGLHKTFQQPGPQAITALEILAHL